MHANYKYRYLFPISFIVVFASHLVTSLSLLQYHSSSTFHNIFFASTSLSQTTHTTYVCLHSTLVLNSLRNFIMTNVNVEEELLSSIASLSPPLSLKSGTLDLPLVTDSSLPLDSNPTPDPTLNATSTTSHPPNKSTSTNLKTRHSPTPPPNNLHFTVDNHQIPQKEI